MTNHHYRSNYESLYYRLCKEANQSPQLRERTSDYTLLLWINNLLVKLGCVPMDEEELEIDLI